LLKWWVAEGASFETTIAEASRPADISFILQAYGLGKIRTGVFALDLPAPDSSLVSSWRSKGVRVDVLAEGESLLSVACRVVADCLTGSESADLAEHITWLDLRNSDMTDENLSSLARFPNLTRLNLAGTAIYGQGLDALGSMEYLEYLNLYDTKVSDTVLDQIAAIKTLTAVYLWQTAVTPEGIAQLQSSLPEAEVDTGKLEE